MQNKLNITNNTGNIYYKGEVTITIKNKKNIISQHTYHNKGNTPLFNFLANCIAGNGYDKRDLPRFVRLFKMNNPDMYPPNGTIHYVENGTPESIPVSPAIYTSASGVESRSGESKAASVYLHFVIPGSNVAAEQSGNKNKYIIHQAGLYSANTVTNYNNYLAAFDFLNDLGGWDPIDLTESKDDFNIFIDWVLTFSNDMTGQTV